ncbi:MAG: hypothetical protein ABSB95_04720 [Dissulfurispiraceae bacterium]|jgi:hypothetical protein
MRLLQICLVGIIVLPCCTLSDVRDTYYRDIKTSVYSLRGIKLVPYYSGNYDDYYYDAQSVRYTGSQYVTVSSIVFPRSEESRNMRIKAMKDKGYIKAPLMYADYSHSAFTYEIDCANRMARNISVIDFAKTEVIYKELDTFAWKRFVSGESDLDSLSNALCP